MPSPLTAALCILTEKHSQKNTQKHKETYFKIKQKQVNHKCVTKFFHAGLLLSAPLAWSDTTSTSIAKAYWRGKRRQDEHRPSSIKPGVEISFQSSSLRHIHETCADYERWRQKTFVIPELWPCLFLLRLTGLDDEQKRKSYHERRETSCGREEKNNIRRGEKIKVFSGSEGARSRISEGGINTAVDSVGVRRSSAVITKRLSNVSPVVHSSSVFMLIFSGRISVSWTIQFESNLVPTHLTPALQQLHNCCTLMQRLSINSALTHTRSEVKHDLTHGGPSAETENVD